MGPDRSCPRQDRRRRSDLDWRHPARRAASPGSRGVLPRPPGRVGRGRPRWPSGTASDQHDGRRGSILVDLAARPAGRLLRRLGRAACLRGLHRSPPRVGGCHVRRRRRVRARHSPENLGRRRHLATLARAYRRAGGVHQPEHRMAHLSRPTRHSVQRELLRHPRRRPDLAPGNRDATSWVSPRSSHLCGPGVHHPGACTARGVRQRCPVGRGLLPDSRRRSDLAPRRHRARWKASRRRRGPCCRSRQRLALGSGLPARNSVTNVTRYGATKTFAAVGLPSGGIGDASVTDAGSIWAIADTFQCSGYKQPHGPRAPAH